MSATTTDRPATQLPDMTPENRRSVPPALVFIVRSLLSGCLTLLVASALIFISVQVLPGNVAETVLGQQATPERVATINEDLGLNEPLPERYATWLLDTLRGDLGNSTAAAVQGTELSVWSDIETPLINTFSLALLATLAFVVISLTLGTWAALRRGRAADRIISSGSLAAGAVPEFVVATLLIAIFFSWLDAFPPVSQVLPGESAWSHPDRLVLPVLTLLASAGSYGIRLVRASVIEVLDQDYVAMARLNGVPERQVLLKYVLRNSVAANVQALANVVRYLVAGIIIVESVFAFPGIGAKLVSAVLLRDLQEVASISFILATLYILINLVADVAVVLLVPRLRTREF